MNLKRISGAGRGVGFWLLTAVLLGYLLFGNLGEMFITDYDEARHGVNAYEMIRSGDYLVSTYQGQPDYWNLKPPLSYWLIALAYRLFGFNAFALRFFSALAMLVAVGAAALWAGHNFSRWLVPLLLLWCAANPGLYGLHFARFGDADAQYQLFFTLAMLCLLSSELDFRWLYGSAVCFGLAFLEKSLHALNIPLICLVALVVTGRIRQLTWKRLGLLLLAALAVIGPWAVARYSRDGMAFFSHMFATDAVARVGSIADPADRALPAGLYYWVKFARNPAMLTCLVFCVFCGVVVFFGRCGMPPASLRAAVTCALWALLPYGFYIASNVRYTWYVYSVFLALPMLACILCASAWRAKRLRGVLVGGLCVTLACLAVFAGQNVAQVAGTRFEGTVQTFLRENLDRELDEGRHAYIQYNEDQRAEWMPADMLTALYCGDTICLDGGVEAFEADDESAILFVTKEQNGDAVQRLQEQEVVRNEDYYLIAFEKE